MKVKLTFTTEHTKCPLIGEQCQTPNLQLSSFVMQSGNGQIYKDYHELYHYPWIYIIESITEKVVMCFSSKVVMFRFVVTLSRGSENVNIFEHLYWISLLLLYTIDSQTFPGYCPLGFLGPSPTYTCENTRVNTRM